MNKVALFILILATGLTACNKKRIKPSGDITTESRSVSAYDEIEVQDAIEVNYTQSTTTSLEIEANSNLHDHIVTEVNNGRLVIRLKNNVNIKNNHTIKVNIYHDDLDAIEASGASKFEVKGLFVSSSLDFKVEGASRLYGNYQLNDSYLKGNGAANINISGSIDDFKVNLSGASTLSDFDMVAQDLDIDMSGASNASLTVNGTMHIKASGASQLYYEGTGSISSINLSGASKVNKN